ncbi:MAG TPA: PEP/pyruvate-binding domain-containing protein [Thiobacillaceae bacterium]|nr:PEP/pyruvate-binding domain-containing protein [Thiobacillaceae bacterium]
MPDRHGDKAANLSRMLAAGLPAPQGFVLGVEALDGHLEALGLAERARALIAALGLGSSGDIRTDAAEIRRRLLDSPLSPDLMACLKAGLEDGVAYAVRSSAPGEDGIETSFAGQFDSVLDCRSPEDVERAVRRVWASLFGERAVEYMRHRRHRPAGMAVLIQRQVDAAVSGVMFTRDPRRPGGNGLLLEYCPGLGEGLVSGQLTPGRLTIDRVSGAVREEQAPEEVLLALDLPGLGRGLRDLALRLEALFGAPQDVEWSLDRSGRLYLLQSRPITALAAAPAGVVWSNANIAENFPDPVCPMLRSFVGLGYAAYFRGLGRAFGISERRLVAMAGALDNLVGCHGGRLYYNLSNIHAVIHLAPGGNWLARYFNQFTGAREFPDLVLARQGRIARAAEFIGVVLQVVWRYLHVQSGVRLFEAEVDAYAVASRPDGLPEKTLPQLAGLLRGFLHIRLERWTGAALADTAAMVCYGVLGALLRGRPGADANDLLKGLPGLASAAPVERLWELSRTLRADPALRALFAEATAEVILARLQAGEHSAFQHALNTYLETWGFRSSGELMLSRPTPREDPLPLLRLLVSYANQDGEGPAEVSLRQAELRHQATRETRRQLGFGRGLAFALVLRATQGAIRLRERARMKQALLYTRLRHVALALGDVLVGQGVLACRDDVLFLEMDEAMASAEVGRLEAASLRQTVAERRAELAAAELLSLPDSFILPEGTSWRPGLAEAPSVSGEGELSGTGACGGRACGHAAVVLDVTEIGRIRPDQVLVTRQTDPGWAAVFFMIKGLVIERGGLLSHGAIIAREYGIPAVVGVRDATRLIADGEAVCVDGDRGRVNHVRH